MSAPAFYRAAAEQAMRGSQQLPHFDFLAHGMGLVSHEAPHLTGKAWKPSKGASVVQRVFSSVELEVQNPTEFKKEFLRPNSIP
jgi:hypothetical protein